MKIALDLDGTVIDMVKECQKWYKQKFGMTPELPVNYYFAREWGLTDEQWIDMVHYAVTNARFFDNRYLECLKYHEVHIVTARSPQYIHNWILEQLNPVSVWMRANKRLACFKIGADMIFDDSIEHLDTFTGSKTIAVCADASWNKDWIGLRAKTVGEAIELVEKKLYSPSAANSGN